MPDYDERLAKAVIAAALIHSGQVALPSVRDAEHADWRASTHLTTINTLTNAIYQAAVEPAVPPPPPQPSTEPPLSVHHQKPPG
jgi:hypothetical protein